MLQLRMLLLVLVLLVLELLLLLMPLLLRVEVGGLTGVAVVGLVRLLLVAVVASRTLSLRYTSFGKVDSLVG